MGHVARYRVRIIRRWTHKRAHIREAITLVITSWQHLSAVHALGITRLTARVMATRVPLWMLLL